MPKKFSQVAQIFTKRTVDKKRGLYGATTLAVLTYGGGSITVTVFQEHNYVAIDKHLEKLPPHFYYIKMKVCHDQESNDIGVVIATK